MSYRDGMLVLGGTDLAPVLLDEHSHRHHQSATGVAEDLQVIGSTHRGLHYLSEVLDLAGKGKVKPIVETFTLDQATEAYDRLSSGKMRFRGVFTPQKG
ncbi:MAG TPA: zinc-binding dehydrogenase [Mycobacterium sp.]